MLCYKIIVYNVLLNKFTLNKFFLNTIKNYAILEERLYVYYKFTSTYNFQNISEY